MDNKQPGVTVIDKALTLSQAQVRSAVPLFIGFTESGPSFALRRVGSAVEFDGVFGGPPPGVVSAAGGVSALCRCVRHYFDNDGAGAFVLSLGSYGDAGRMRSDQVAAAFADPRIADAVKKEAGITLIAAPDLVLLPDSDIAAWKDAWQALLTLCQCRVGLFGLLDAPDAPYAVVNGLSTFSATGREWGAAYWPRLVAAEKEGAVVIPPSGAIAAVIERVDRQSGVWTAPANVVLAHVVAPAQSHLEVEDEWLCGGASFNLIKAFPGRGTRVWGCRTLSTDARSPGRYVQVRRLLSYIETSIRQLVQMFIFEPNNEITWFKVNGQVSNWLRELWLLGGLYGAEEAQAFEVAVGLDETMTEAEVAAGLMVMRIRVCALHPAEFIELELQFDMGLATEPEEA